MSSVYSAGASLGSGGVFLTFLGLIAFGLPIKSDFSQFHRFFSKDSIGEKRQGDKEMISLLAKSEKYPSDRYLPANEPLLRPVREIILGKRRFLRD
jgi:hypothetical protein